MRAKIVERFGTDLEIQFEVDASLIGGVYLRVGDQVIDGIVAHHMPEKAHAELWDTAGLRERCQELLGLELPIAEWAQEEGVANAEIAERLFVSVAAAKYHVSSILSKLGVRDRTRAVLKAFELGIV